MKRVTALRVASALLVTFCALHTVGGMLLQKSLGPASDAVFAAMNAVHFDFNGSDCTWYGFWLGFGLTVSAFLLMSAIVCWQLDRVPSASWPHVAPIAWALGAAHAFNTLISWRYFFAGPVAFSTVITALIAYANVRKSRAE